jgi:hypothetical protein
LSSIILKAIGYVEAGAGSNRALTINSMFPQLSIPMLTPVVCCATSAVLLGNLHFDVASCSLVVAYNTAFPDGVATSTAVCTWMGDRLENTVTAEPVDGVCTKAPHSGRA